MSDNKALTLEQLREMDGEPVYLIVDDGCEPLEMWALIDVPEKDHIVLINNIGGRSAYYSDDDLERDHITVYRRPPEGGEINKITVVQHLGRLEDVALRPVSRERVEKVFPGCEKCRNQANWPSWIEKGFVYCPKCGTPLASWAWEKQIERLEVLYNETR